MRNFKTTCYYVARFFVDSCPYQKLRPQCIVDVRSIGLLRSRGHESCPIVVSFYAALVFTVTSKYANRDSCAASSTCCVAASEEAGEPRSSRPFALGTAFTYWNQWRSAQVVVKPETVIAWHRNGFRLYWRWKSRAGKCGRPCVSRETRDLIRQMRQGQSLMGKAIAREQKL